MSPIRAGGYWPRSAFRTAENSPSTSPGTRRHCTPDRCSEVHRDIPAIVRSKALAAGATQWIHDLPDLVASIEQDWSIAVGRPYRDSTEAFVAQATLGDGAPAVLKLRPLPCARATRAPDRADEPARPAHHQHLRSRVPGHYPVLPARWRRLQTEQAGMGR